MEKKFCIVIATILLVCLVVTSCKKDDPITITEPDTSEEPNTQEQIMRTIDTKIVLNDVWYSKNQRKDSERNRTFS